MQLHSFGVVPSDASKGLLGEVHAVQTEAAQLCITFAFAHQHNADNLLDVALSLIMDNIGKLTRREEYMELVEEDLCLIVEIYEAYLSKQAKINYALLLMDNE